MNDAFMVLLVTQTLMSTRVLGDLYITPMIAVLIPLQVDIFTSTNTLSLISLNRDLCKLDFIILSITPSATVL